MIDDVGQLVENEDMIGTLIETNDRIIAALESYDQVRPVPPSSVSPLALPGSRKFISSHLAIW